MKCEEAILDTQWSTKYSVKFQEYAYNKPHRTSSETYEINATLRASYSYQSPLRKDGFFHGRELHDIIHCLHNHFDHSLNPL